MAPSAKVSPALVMERFVAFSPFFELGFVFLLKSNFLPYCPSAVHDMHSQATAKIRCSLERETQNLDATLAPALIVLQISE